MSYQVTRLTLISKLLFGLFGFYEFGNPLVSDGIFLEEPMVFTDQRRAEFGNGCGLQDVEAIDFTGEYLFEVGDVAIDSLNGVACSSAGFCDTASFQEKESANFLFMRERWAEVMNGPSAR